MSARARIVAGALTGLALIVAIVIATSGDDTYELGLRLDNAAGLRDGSPVSIGGVRVGKVKLKLGDHDQVDVALKIEQGKRVPKNARVGISAVNLLGQKQVAFIGGDPAQAAPDGYEIPASRVTKSTDLDQVLDTLDADTRTRLSILVNEAGAGVMGRRWEISRDIDQLPRTLSDAHLLLGQLVSDNRTLANVVTSSDRFIATTTAGRADLVRLIDTLGETSKTVEAKRAQLAATLAKAPGTLRTMQSFLGDLERTTGPLGPAARAITATSPALQDTLGRVDAFRASADPTLKTASAVAPTLTRLGTESTPVVREAQPTVASLSKLAPAARPLTDALDNSADNLIATVENWSQAIQLRDGLSHIFRGEGTFSPDAVASVLDRIKKPASQPSGRRKTKNKNKTAPAPAPSTPAPSPAAPTPRAPLTLHLPLPKSLGKLPDTLKKTTSDIQQAVHDLGDVPKGLLQKQPKASEDTPRRDANKSLLDFLLKP